MNTAFRFLCSCLYSAAFAFCILTRDQNENDDSTTQKYVPYISGSILPAFLLIWSIVGFITAGMEETFQLILSLCFGIFLHISLYYIILLPLMPFLRRHISSRACSMLWLLPNYLYICHQSYMSLSSPRFVIHIPTDIIWILFYIWLTGFIIVFLWKIISHIMFRRHVLYNSYIVRDPDTLKCMTNEIEKARLKYKNYKLFISPIIETPFSIGLFKRTTCIILPKKNYTSEELTLIFRHEIIHIGREDAWSKFFSMFCTAVCWFNPLMWIAMRKSADDMELSCDESVLLDAADTERQHYASLILKTAGDERGFTTCLSASAKALRYRLQNIVSIRKKHSGAGIVGIISFLLFMSYGYISLAYEYHTGAEMIYQGENPDSCIIEDIDVSNDIYSKNYYCTDMNAFHEYMTDLSFYSITGNYDPSEYDHCLSIDYRSAKGGIMWVSLYDHTIELSTFEDGDVHSVTYYLSESTDWDYLMSILVDDPVLG